MFIVHDFWLQTDSAVGEAIKVVILVWQECRSSVGVGQFVYPEGGTMCSMVVGEICSWRVQLLLTV